MVCTKREFFARLILNEFQAVWFQLRRCKISLPMKERRRLYFCSAFSWRNFLSFVFAIANSIFCTSIRFIYHNAYECKILRSPENLLIQSTTSQIGFSRFLNFMSLGNKDFGNFYVLHSYDAFILFHGSICELCWRQKYQRTTTNSLAEFCQNC